MNKGFIKRELPRFVFTDYDDPIPYNSIITPSGNSVEQNTSKDAPIDSHQDSEANSDSVADSTSYLAIFTI